MIRPAVNREGEGNMAVGQQKIRQNLRKALDPWFKNLTEQRIMLEESANGKHVAITFLGYSNMHHAYKMAFASAMDVSRSEGGRAIPDYSLDTNTFSFKGNMHELATQIRWNVFANEIRKETARLQNVDIYRA
jgi:hypothetical protein